MKKIFLIWEMGDDLGHIVSLLVIARSISTKNIKIFLAVKDISQLHKIDQGLLKNIKLIQSPRQSKSPSQSLDIRSLPQIFRNQGFRDIETLHPLVEAWKTLFELVQPDVVIFDYAPIALLASKFFQFKTMIYGTSFDVPVPGYPSADLKPWSSPVSIEAIQAESHVKNVINEVFSGTGKSVDFLSSLYVADKTVLKGIPQLDAYKNTRASSVCYLADASHDYGANEVRWLENGYPKVFGYLKWRYPIVKQILNALRLLKVDACIYAPGVDAETLRQFENTNLIICQNPVNDSQAVSQSDAILSHGGIGLVSKAVIQGKPVGLFPTQLEQANTAFRVEGLGYGKHFRGFKNELDLSEQLNSFLCSDRIKAIVKTASHSLLNNPRSISMDQLSGQILDLFD